MPDTNSATSVCHDRCQNVHERNWVDFNVVSTLDGPLTDILDKHLI